MITENMRIATLLAFCVLLFFAAWGMLPVKEDDIQREEEFVQTIEDEKVPIDQKYNFIEEE